MTVTPFPNRPDRWQTTSTEELHRMKKKCESRLFNFTRQIAWEHEYRDKIMAEIALREQEARSAEPPA